MCRSMVDVQCAAADVRRGKKDRQKIERNHRAKIQWPALLDRAAINEVILQLYVRGARSRLNASGPRDHDPVLVDRAMKSLRKATVNGLQARFDTVMRCVDYRVLISVPRVTFRLAFLSDNENRHYIEMRCILLIIRSTTCRGRDTNNCCNL